jgi:hypothetical protein
MDSSRATYWLYTNGSLFELLAVDEDRDVWSAYLEKNEHAAALVYAKVRPMKHHLAVQLILLSPIDSGAKEYCCSFASEVTLYAGQI